MKLVTYILLLVVVIACSDTKKLEKPSNLIPKEKMIDVYVETYLSNAARSVDNRFIRNNAIKLDSFIYKKFAIDSLQFVKSNEYYASDLDVYEALFLEVEKRILAIKDETEAVLKEIEKKDSIAAIKKDTTQIDPEGQLLEPISVDTNE